MADNIPITAGSGTDVATDDVGGVHYQKVKVALGLADAVDTLLDSGQQTMSASVPVVLASDQPDVKITLDSEAVVLGAGSAAIGKLAANDGVDIGNVDVASIAAGDNNIGNVDVVTLPGVAGDVAHGSSDSGNPVKLGLVAETTYPTAVSDGQRVNAIADVYGAQFVRTDHPRLWSMHYDGSAAQTDLSVQSAPGAGLSVYITDIVVSTGAATALNVFFEEGSTKILGPYYLEAVAGRGLAIHFLTPKKCTANTAVTVTTSAAIAQSIDVMGFIAP